MTTKKQMSKTLKHLPEKYRNASAEVQIAYFDGKIDGLNIALKKIQEK